MTDFRDKFRDAKWLKKRDDMLLRFDYRCEECDVLYPQAQIFISFYLSDKEPWEQPDNSYRCYCLNHKNMRRSVEVEIKKTFAALSINELDQILSAMERISAIPSSVRPTSLERFYLFAKNEYKEYSERATAAEYNENDEYQE